jgi:dCMP deaminase
MQKPINWDEYFMSVALLSAKRSKDPSTKVGACIVDENKHIIGTGYNGAPRGFDDNEMPWGREGEFLQTKYPYVVHAELNAILNSTRNLKGSKLYVTLFCCNECAKAIAQSGIEEIIYLENKYKTTDGVKAAELILKNAKVKVRQFKTELVNLELSYKN